MQALTEYGTSFGASTLRAMDRTIGTFDAVILPHRRSLFAQAHRLTGNASDAEDLVQETLLRAYTRQDQLTASETAGAWLHTMQRNLFINAYRKRQKAPQMTELTEVRAERTEARQRTTESPEVTVARRLEYQALRRALVALPARYREILHLADVEQLSYQEIADRMEMPVGTIRSRIARGRQRLQRALRGWHL
ncbi:MAG: sigma-70 family RNA polymerase sigma factor [Capsulimonadales bacterium]|nr:sigma-70 family RNA polymerase sigma factor [Capsulimonadales bacterium]